MLYFVKELDNLSVKATSPKNALRKTIRLFIRHIKAKNKDIFTIRNENITLTDANGSTHEYLFTITQPTSLKNTTIYYQLDYDIDIWKRLGNI